MKPRILFLAFADYSWLEEKGVASKIMERDEGGFFEKVISVHPASLTTRTIKLNDVHAVYDYGLDMLPEAKKYRWMLYLQAPFQLVRVIYNVVCLVKNKKINIIRATDPFWSGFIALIVSLATRIPYCVSIHADYDKRDKLQKSGMATTVYGSQRLGRFLARMSLSNANLVMPIRVSLGDWAVKYGAKANKIHYIPHGVDLSLFSGPPTKDIYRLLGISEEKKIISFVGRLVRENYVDDVLKLAAKLASRRDDCIIVMAGGGSEEKNLAREINTNPSLANIIKLVGFLPYETVVDLRKASYLSLCLMGGYSLIEACAAQRPVISYDVEWHHELAITQRTGFLVRENDIAELEKATSYLLDNPYEADKMGR